MAVAPDQNYEAVVARLKARAAQNSQPTAAVAPGAASLSAQPTPTPTEAPAQPTEPGLMDRLGSALNTAVDTGIRSTLALSPLGLLGSQHVARGALNAKDKLFKDNEQELADRTSQIERINRLNEDIRILGTVGIDRKDDPATRLAKVNQQRFLDGMDLLPDSEAKRYEDKGFSEIDYSQAGDVFGAVSIPRAMEQVYALRRMEDGKANARDLKSVADMLDRERNRYIPSKKYGFISPSGVTEGILFAIPFAIEMATTGGLATVGKKAGAGLVSKVGGRAIVNRVSEFMASTAGKKMTELTAKQLAGRGLVKLAAAPFEAAGRLPAIAPKFVAQGRIESLPKVEFTQEQAGVFRANLDATDESWGRETLRQGVSQYVELISEATGGAINIGGNLVGRAIGKLTPAQVRQVLGGMATFARRAGTKAEYAMGGRKALRITRKFREKALWDGLAAEWGEEDLSTALQWASTKISEFTGIEGLDLGQQSITAYGNPDELITRAGVLLGLRGASATPGWVASAGGSKKGGRKPVMLNKEQQAAVDEMSRQAMRAGASGPLGDLGVLDLEIEEADAEAQAAGDAVPPVDAQGDAVEAPGVQGSRVGADTVLDEIAQPQEQAPQTATDAPQVTALPTQVTADANEQSQGTTDTKTGPSSPAGVEVAPEAGTGVDRSPLTPETSTPEPIEKPAAEVVPPVEKPKVAAVAPAPKLEMEQSVVPEESAKKPLHKMTLDEYAQDRVRRAGGGDLKRQRRKGLPVHREAVKQAIERGEIVDYKVIKEYEGNFWADEYLDKVAKKFGEYDRKPYGKINRLGFSNLRGKPSSRIAKMGGFDAEAFAALDFHDVFDGISDAQMARLAPGKGKYGKVSLDRVAEMLSGQPALQGEFNEVDPYGRPVHDDVIEWLVKYLHQRVDTVRDMERAQDEFEKLDAMAEKHAEEQAARGELDLPEADQANDSNYDPSDIPFSAGLSSKQERAGKLKSHEREVVRGLNDAANGSKNDKIKVVQRKTDLPDGIQKQAARMGDRVLVDGAYDPATDTVYFVVEDMAKRARELGVNPRLYAAAKFLHEAGLHRGLRGMFESREAMDAFLDQVIETVGRDKLPGLVGEAYAGRPAREQAEEYLAGIAEKMVNGDYLTPKRRSVWKRLIAAAKDWLRRLGVKLRLSDAELNDVVARAVQWGLSGEPGAGATVRSQKPLYSRESSPDLWYSKLVNTIHDASLPKKATGAQYKKLLESLSKKGQFKLNEMEESGLSAWLDRQGEITREELIAHVDEEAIDVREVELRSEPTVNQREQILRIEEMRDRGGQISHSEAERRIGDIRGKPPKFAQYQLPGGTNYREVLLTLPVVTDTADSLPLGWFIRRETNGSYSVYNSEGEPQVNEKTEGEALNKAQKFADRKNWQRASKETFTTHHFDEPNIIAHVRLNDRTGPNGEKILFVEEIQSDWHQQGREKGYTNSKLPDVLDEDRALYNSDLPEGLEARIVDGENWQVVDVRNGARFGMRWGTMRQAIENYLADQVEPDSLTKVPDAPFKKNWHELALKRVMRMAADGDYDAVAWTTGEQQAERYDLSKQVSRIYLPEPVWSEDDSEISGHIAVTDMAGNDIYSERADYNRIKELIGKEAAQRLKDNPSRMEGRTHVLEGEGLKVGGEGMKGFYDRMLPVAVNKMVKQYGARVVDIEIGTSNKGKMIPDGTGGLVRSATGEAKMETVHSVEVTPEMRQDFSGPQALFSIGQGQSLSGSEKKLDAESQAEMEAALEEISRRDAMGEDRQKAMLRFLRAVLPAKERGDVLREIREKRGDYIDQPDQYFQLALRSISRRVGQLQKSKGITVGRGKTLEQAARALEVILKGRGSQPAAVALRPGTIIKETYRAGEKKGFAKGFVRAVEDVIDTSFRKIASEYRGQYDRWEGALRTVEEELENLDAALAKRFPRETDEEFEKRAEFTRRRALINMFGEDRYGMIRRATKGDVEKSLERVRERMNVEWNRFYTKALTRITKRVNAKDLFNGPGDHNFADQWRKLVEPFKEIEKLVQKRRDLKALRSKLREDPGTTPAQFDNLEQQMNDIIEGIAKVWRSVPMKEARDLYTKFVALEAQSKAAVEAVKGLEKVKVFELGELVGGEVAANHDELNKKDGEKARRNRTFWKRFLIDSRGDMESRALTMGGGNEKSVSKKILHDDIVEANSKAMTAHEDARADLRNKINELGITNREIDNIQGKVKLHKILGEQYGFTDAQLMDMYLILKREGMVAQVERNGVKSAERKGVNRIGKDLLRNYDPEVNLIEELNNVISTLDPKLLELADFMQRRLVDMSADGNVTALKILGKEKFLEQGYWPKSVDRSGTTALQVAKLEQLRGASPAEILTQLGMLQDTVPHGNPIVVNNVFDVFDDGALQMADFTHMAIPTIRALNVLNEANDEISGRLGLDFSRRIYDTIARATHLKKHSDNWNWLQRQASAIERRATTSILGFRFTSIANNLIGGSIFYASELAKIDPKLALDFIAQSGRAVMRGKRGDAANDRILQDGYFKHRWVSDPINVQGHLPTDVTTYKSATQRKIRRLQELGTRAMTWAEKNNAIRAYVTLTKNGYSEQEAVDLIQKMTRRTQNPSTAIEESGFYTAVKETGGAGLIFPFFGQPTVASNILLKDAQKLFYAMKTNNGKAKAATDLALTLSALSFNSIFASRLQLLIGLAAAGALGAGGDDDEKERQKWYAMSRLITEHFDSALPGIGYLFGDTASKFIESMVKDENSVGEAASDAFEEFRQFFNDNMFGSIVSRTGRSFSNVVEAWSDEDYEKLLKNSLNLADSLGALSGMPTGGFVQGGKVIGGLTGATVEEPSAGRGGGGSNF